MRKLLGIPLALALFVGIIFVAAIVTSIFPTRELVFEPQTYEDCVRIPGSIIQESFPAVCITQSGARFVQEISSPSPVATLHPSATRPDRSFCGGIAGMTCPKGFSCQIQGSFPDAGGSCVDTKVTPLVQTPLSGEHIKSPYTVSGIVPPGWMFEGIFPFELIDEKGIVVAQGQAKETVSGSWSSGEPIAFQATLVFNTKQKAGTLILKNDNPSGLAEKDQQIEIPVIFDPN